MILSFQNKAGESSRFIFLLSFDLSIECLLVKNSQLNFHHKVNYSKKLTT
jgi:hypothetical protein